MERTLHPQRKLQFVRRHLDQCMYSAPARKSTTISLNCVNSARLSRRCTHKQAHEAVVQGKDPGQANFHTKKLSQFPQLLCRKLAKVHLETMLLDERPRPFAHPLRTRLSERLEQLYPQEVVERVQTVEELRLLGRLPSKMCPSPFSHWDLRTGYPWMVVFLVSVCGIFMLRGGVRLAGPSGGGRSGAAGPSVGGGAVLAVLAGQKWLNRRPSTQRPTRGNMLKSLEFLLSRG